MSVTVFLSGVSDEFRADREQLRVDFTRHNIHVKEQDEFKDLGRGTLAKLDEYIVLSDAVVHLVGKLAGASPGVADQNALVEKYPGLTTEFPPIGEALKNGGLSYAQWEAWLSLYHDKVLLIARAPGDLGAAQEKHLARLKAAERFPCCEFTSADNLAKQLYAHGVLDLLVKDYAEEIARERDAAEGFIHEMATKVAGDRNLDFEGKKQAVRNAIEIYEQDIAGGLTQTNFGEIVDKALAKAKARVDEGKSSLARATLRKVAEDLEREESERYREQEERRATYVERVTALYNRERDIALASYDGEAAAEAVVARTEAVHGVDRAEAFRTLKAETKALLDHGRDKGSNVHLVAAIALRRKLLKAASTNDERGNANNNLGIALATLGERENTSARLEQAVEAFLAALEGFARERVPLLWAHAQNNLGNALCLLGTRESGTTRLEQAVAAYRAALEEHLRERAPHLWSDTQNNLGNALYVLGTRESGTTQLKQAVAAFRAALQERTRERAPLEWAQTNNNLGNVFRELGFRLTGTAHLVWAVAAFRRALQECTRERFPLDWAMTQYNLANTFGILGGRDIGGTWLEQAITAFEAALDERTRERAPLDWARTQMGLGAALSTLGERERETGHLTRAVAAYRAALEELTRERVPLDWASTQNNLGVALKTLGERESGTERLEEAVAAFHEALKEWRPEVALYWHGAAQQNLANCLAVLEQRADPPPRDPSDPTTWGEIKRNESCPCGSGKRYKHCHGALV